MSYVDMSGQPRRAEEIEQALHWVKKRIIRPDFSDPEGVIMSVTIKDALQELLQLRHDKQTSKVDFSSAGVLPADTSIAQVWVDGSKLCIRMSVDNVFDVEFVDTKVLRPRFVSY